MTVLGFMKRPERSKKNEGGNPILLPLPSIDHPQKNELLRLGYYAIRISGPENSEVQISFNEKDWSPCRFSVGYWWFDWKPQEPGIFKVIARSRSGKGRWKKSEKRMCSVTLTP